MSHYAGEYGTQLNQSLPACEAGVPPAGTSIMRAPFRLVKLENEMLQMSGTPDTLT